MESDYVNGKAFICIFHIARNDRNGSLTGSNLVAGIGHDKVEDLCFCLITDDRGLAANLLEIKQTGCSTMLIGDGRFNADAYADFSAEWASVVDSPSKAVEAEYVSYSFNHTICLFFMHCKLRMSFEFIIWVHKALKLFVVGGSGHSTIHNQILNACKHLESLWLCRS